MNQKVLTKLEFHKIKDLLKNHAVSEAAKSAIDEMIPRKDIKEVNILQKETAQALSMSVKKGVLPLSGLREIRSILKRAKMGALLNSSELLDIRSVLKVCAKAKKYHKEDDKNTIPYPMIDPYFEQIVAYPSIEKQIDKCIMGPDSFADDATPELFQIRKQIKTVNAKIKETLQGILHSHSYQDILQEPVITIRQDRYCLPIKIEHKGQFKGIVHDQSATGATVFMEPMQVVELNNQLKGLEHKEHEEIQKILAMLTMLIVPIIDELKTSYDTLVQLDVIFARSEFALKIDAREPKINDKGYINLRNARHPLLDKNSVVPINIYVGDQFTSLLITGPNTGGKTVTLKTIGLFTLMMQSGMQIPASEGSEMAVFDEVFADLGDEQSIEQSLSTFSSHMTNIVSILNHMTTNSLVLLDELGSGTDPVEGAALAMAILEHLRKQRIRTVATTHYSELKLYALSTEGVENASCEFDIASLRPTYKLLIGIPGKSNAFAISQKLGLALYLIEDAKEFLKKENVKMEDILVDLEQSKRIAEVEKEKASSYRNEAERLKEEIKKEQRKLEKAKKKVLERAEARAQAMLKTVEEETDRMLKEVRQAARKAQVVIDEKSLQDVKQGVKETLTAQTKHVQKVAGVRQAKQRSLKEVTLGQEVMVTNLMQKGIVVEMPDSNQNVMVRIGVLPIKAHLSNLQGVDTETTEETKKGKKKALGQSVSYKLAKTMTISPEIDVRGMLSDEAISIVDKYLDDAYLSGLNKVTIIHGKGTGALRQAIGTMLKRHPHAATFRPGTYGEGEMGVTIVEIK